jgi:hypothetical protein
MNLPKRLPTPYTFYEEKETIFLEMGIGENGLKYEKKIYNNLVKASKQIKSITDVEKPKGNNCNQPDITVTWNDRDINFEVKSKHDDPLGNFSLRHVLGENDFDLSSEALDHKDKESLSSIFAEKLDAIDAYIKFARKQEPRSYNSKINQFPMYLSQEGAEAARVKGLAKAIADYSTKDVFDITTVFGLYNNGKNTYYIQIGGYGLYCLGYDKYKLGVPELKGKCIVEIRPFASGVKERKDKKTGKVIDVVSMGLRASPRLTEINDKSRVNLENIDDIISLFG